MTRIFAGYQRAFLSVDVNRAGAGFHVLPIDLVCLSWRAMFGDTTDGNLQYLARGLAILRAFRASDSGLTHARCGCQGCRPRCSRLTIRMRLGILATAGRNEFGLGPWPIRTGLSAAVAVNFLDLVWMRCSSWR